MISTRLDELRRTKGLRENRDLSLRQVAIETGLSFNTLQRLRKGTTERVALSTLDKLCDYFGLESLCELIERLPEHKPDGAEKSTP
jgi:DNA-binding Xre family transcriptional regulator